MATISTGRYVSDSTNYREGAFRFGGQITFEGLRQQYYRDDIFYFLCRIIIEESVGKGFEVVDENDEILDWNEDLQEVLPMYIDEFIRGLAMERRDGRVLLAFMTKESDLVFRSFTHDFYGVEYDDLGIVEKAVARSRIHNRPADIDHRFEGAQLDGVREVIFRRREKVNSGMSYIEPIYDVVVALYFVVSHIAYHVARSGAGIKAVEAVNGDGAPIDPLDDEAVDHLLDKMTEFGSASDVLYLPPGVKLVTELLKSGTQVKWKELFDILLARISIYSGVPHSRLVGLVPGQQEGAEINEESYFDVLRDIQTQVKPVIIWFVRRIVDFHDFGSDDFDILFNVREEMSEVDQIDIDTKKLELAQKYISLGFTRERAFDKAGIEFDGSDLEEEEEEEEFLSEEDDTDDVDSVEQSPEEEDEE